MINTYEYEVVIKRVDGNEITNEDKRIINELGNTLWESSCAISGISKSFDAEENTSVFMIGHVKVEETNNNDNFESVVRSKVSDFVNEHSNMEVMYRKSIIENNKRISVGDIKLFVGQE